VAISRSRRERVHLYEQRRHVRLDSGEAFFEVTKHAEWPFVVSVGS